MFIIIVFEDKVCCKTDMLLHKPKCSDFVTENRNILAHCLIEPDQDS
jgi:hypothetical protein